MNEFNESNFTYKILGKSELWNELSIIGDFNENIDNNYKISFDLEWIIKEKEFEIINKNNKLYLDYSFMLKELKLQIIPSSKNMKYLGKPIIVNFGTIKFPENIKETLKNYINIKNNKFIFDEFITQNKIYSKIFFIWDGNKLIIKELINDKEIKKIYLLEINNLQLNDKNISFELKNKQMFKLRYISDDFEKDYLILLYIKYFWLYKNKENEFFNSNTNYNESLNNIIRLNTFQNIFVNKIYSEQISSLKRKLDKETELNIFWKEKYESTKSINSELNELLDNKEIIIKQKLDEIQLLKKKIEESFEEKNFFLNNLNFKIDDASFLSDYKIKNNETLNFTFIEDEFNKFNLKDDQYIDYKELEIKYNDQLDKNKLLEKNILNYKLEIRNIKLDLEKKNFDNILKENNNLKNEIKILKKENKDLKINLKKINFAYKYVLKELENVNNISNMFKNAKKDDNLLQANNIVNSLTLELFKKNDRIENLLEELNKIKLDYTMNQTLY